MKLITDRSGLKGSSSDEPSAHVPRHRAHPGETAAAAARQRQEEAEKASAKATEAEEAAASAAEQAELNRNAEAAAAKAKEAREKAIDAAEHAGLEPPDLEPLAADAMPRRGMARKADATLPGFNYVGGRSIT